MNRRGFTVLMSFVVIAIFFGIIGWLTLSPAIKWVAPVIAIEIALIGLGVNNISMAFNVDTKIEAMNRTLNDIKRIQKEIQEKQKEQANSGSPVVTSLQALSQYYMDFLAKQKGEQSNEES